MMTMRREVKEDPGPCLPTAPCSSYQLPTRKWDSKRCTNSHQQNIDPPRLAHLGMHSLDIHPVFIFLIFGFKAESTAIACVYG